MSDQLIDQQTDMRVHKEVILPTNKSTFASSQHKNFQESLYVMFVCLLMLTLISPTPLQKLLARLTWMSLFWSASTWRGARLTTGLRRASASPPPPELARLAGPESWSWRSTTVEEEETGLRRRWCQGSVPRSSVSGRPRQDMTPQRGIVCVCVCGCQPTTSSRTD